VEAPKPTTYPPGQADQSQTIQANQQPLLPSCGSSLSPSRPLHGCVGSDLSPRSGPPTDQIASSQGPLARGLLSAHGSLQAGKWNRKLNPPTYPSTTLTLGDSNFGYFSPLVLQATFVLLASPEVWPFLSP
jgi:hypothetical protein